jgi:AAA domain-containing protein
MKQDVNDVLRTEGVAGVIRMNDAARPYRSAGTRTDTRTDTGSGEKGLIQSSGDFVADYVAPEYMIDGIFQRRRIYSLTGKTGDGKTAMQLYIAYSLAERVPVGRREVEQCRVLYLAGENPDDIRARWLAMSDVLGFDVNTVTVCFIPGVFSISGMIERPI